MLTKPIEAEVTDELLDTADNNYHTPEWAKHVIWYQIFPERFRNGDSSNDPTGERVNGPEGWAPTPWTSDWYDRADWEKSMGDSFMDGVYHRRYGGDLQGVIDKLDYLMELGIGALYLNPIFEAVSLHKYDASCYRHIDRFFGPDPEGDRAIIEQEDPQNPATWQWTSADKLFLKLIEEVHNRDMKIIIDGVFNHTGTDFWAFRDLAEKQDESIFKDWYAVKSFNDPYVGSVFDYEGWWGHKSLPELKEEGDTLVKPVREHIFEITKRWMDPNGDGNPSDGVDGWRLDVPEEVGKGFWKEWNAVVRSINPEAYTVGELWTSDSKEWVSGELFTAAMNYPFAKSVQRYIIDQSISTNEFLDELEEVRNSFPKDAPYVMQNLMDSHDTPRLASMVVNPGREYNEDGRPKLGFDVRKPNAEERRIQKLVSLFQYTYVGAPMIYYGTEAGMWGAGDPDDRKPMVWPDFEYDPERLDPLDRERPVDDNNFDEKLFNWYKKLGEIRNEHEVLQTGNFVPLPSDEQEYFVFARQKSSLDFAIVVINRSEEPRQIKIPLANFELPEHTYLENQLTDTGIEFSEHSAEISLPPVSGAILIPEQKDQCD
ncbi:glycoside hydrolase family 13 protein [Fodinibius salsisoli]|uniref:Glycoside hydrolase family 13 protein n=1 Tax=Fodinibius salsisoli TaxID=2820877 RepID=A0ABT3PMJ7_9BACT|nr:glycoside hydrolase family 13 protein [Fodinibius salsisoli]MCW9707156.1 glycoside hydrolase family 13 protein [Fodinibius salsisoli]